MSDITVEQMADEIIKIEEESLKKRIDVLANKDRYYGKSKIDSDAVNKIIAVLDAGGVGSEN